MTMNMTPPAAEISLVKALKMFFDIPAQKMITEFKPLTDQDRMDFVEMFAEIGWKVTRERA